MAQNPFSSFASGAENALGPGPGGGFLPSRTVAEGVGDPFLNEAREAFRTFVARQEFPCLGAKAAFNAGSYAFAAYDALASDATTAALADDLFKFTRSEIRAASEYATFAAVFRHPAEVDEVAFERLLWRQLAMLNRADAAHFEYCPDVRSDPADPQFSFSFAEQALYVIGMHPKASREARRFDWPMIVFNPHEQFERLRADGKWKRMQQTIRERDVELQGSINPMLSDFGEVTEARQYSGRAVEPDWRAPFDPVKPSAGKCPFGHV